MFDLDRCKKLHDAANAILANKQWVFFQTLVLVYIITIKYFSFRNTSPFTLHKFSPVLDVILKYAKELDIDLEVRDGEGQTPLDYMYARRSKEQVKQFLDAAKKEYNIEFEFNRFRN